MGRGRLAVASSAVRALPGPGGGVAAADGASNFFRAASAASALALRARSGRRRERAAACFFGWVPGPAPAGRASARKNNVKSPRREEPSLRGGSWRRRVL